MSIARPTKPLDRPTRPPTDAELRAMAKTRPTTAEIDAMLATTAKLWAVPAAQWRKIAAALNRRTP